MIWYNYNRTNLFRGVAQLVARAVWDREVEGSSPFTPTSLFFLHDLHDLTTGCGAVGSARRSGRRGRPFKSDHPDQQKYLRIYPGTFLLFCDSEMNGRSPVV